MKYVVSRMYLKKYNISSLNGSVKSNSLFWYYVKQIMDVFIRAMVRIFSFDEKCNVPINSTIDVQYRQSESDGESHRTSFTMDPIEFFHTGHMTNIHIHYIT